MWIDAVVIDASPLITLFRSGQADLLPRLFNQIIVPEAVWQEVVDERHDAAALGLTRQAWPIREKVPISPRAALQRLSLGFQKIDMHKSSIFQRHMLVKYFPNSRKNIFYVM